MLTNALIVHARMVELVIIIGILTLALVDPDTLEQIVKQVRQIMIYVLIKR